MKAHSMDLRERVAAAVDRHEESQREIARRFDVSLSFVVRLLQHRRETGGLEPSRPSAPIAPTPSTPPPDGGSGNWSASIPTPRSSSTSRGAASAATLRPSGGRCGAWA